MNPAVTCGLLATGKISVLRGILYIFTQCIGAIAGTAALRALLPEELHNSGHTMINSKLLPLQGLGIEFFLGFVLVFCVYGVCDSNKQGTFLMGYKINFKIIMTSFSFKDSRFIAPLAIGLTVGLGHLGCIKFTGASMNPARTFGTAVVQNNWENHWVYK